MLTSLLTAPIRAHAAEEIDWSRYETMTVMDRGTAILLAPATSITSFDASDLSALGIEDVGDLAAFVPNLEIREGANSNAAFFIRGVGLQDLGANATGAVTILQDGVPISTSALQLTGLFDIGQIEIGRGPQSTGSFRNASAGAISIVPNAPQGEFAGNIDYSLHRFNSVDIPDAFRHELDIGFSVPVIEDLLSARIAGRFSRLDPYWENGCSKAPDIPFPERPEGVSYCGENPTSSFGLVSTVPGNLDPKTGRNTQWAFRGMLRLQPTDRDFDWRLSMSATHESGDSRVGQAVGTGPSGTQYGTSGGGGYLDRDLIEERESYEARGFEPGAAVRKRAQNLNDRPLDRRPYRGDWNRDGNARRETLNGTLITRNGIGHGMTLTTHTSWAEYRRYGSSDQDLTPNALFEATTDDKAWQAYFDAELEGNVEAHALRWRIGTYQMLERLKNVQDGVALQRVRPTRSYLQKTRSAAAWGEIEVEFLDDFTFAAGARYQWDQKRFDLEFLRPPITLPGVFIDLNEDGSERKTWDDMTWSLRLSYAFSANFSTSIKYSRGWKAGTFNPGLIVPNTQTRSTKDGSVNSAQPEKLDAFEWSIEARAWDDRIHARLWTFFYDYQNYQVFLFKATVVGVEIEVLNSENAINYGLEYDVTLHPLRGFVPSSYENLRIDIRGSWLDSRFVDFTDFQFRRVESSGGAIPVTVDFSDNPLPSAPQVQISGGATWVVELGRYGRLVPRYDFSWTDDVPFDAAKGKGSATFRGDPRHPDYTIGQRKYALHNIRLSWFSPEATGPGVELAGWCRNLTDERYVTYAADLSNFAQTTLNFVGDPRSCGADVSLRW